jgi:hypothetical protein
MSEPHESVGSRRQPPNALEAEAIATLGYIYGYPLVLMDATRATMESITPVNQFDHKGAFPDDTFKDVVRPNVDTLYSIAWVDLGREPIVLSVPDLGRRYYTMQIMDAWSNVIASPGTRTTGNGKAAFAIMGPGWRGEVPSSVDRIKSPSNMVWIVGRTYTAGTRDYEAVHALQRQYQLVPLGAWGKSAAPAREPSTPTRAEDRDSDSPPETQVEKLSAARFFDRLARLMGSNPPAPNDDPILGRLGMVGIVPGQPFDLARLPATVADAVESGVAAARARLRGADLTSFGKTVNGWQFLPGDVGRYGSNYELRAVVALRGLGANLPDDAVYPLTGVDAAGQPLSGQHRYRLRFGPGALPPVKAFWSLTIYGEDDFLVPNPIGRYALGDRDSMRAEPDGTLDMFIQHDDPGPERRANWLPAPAGGFSLALRLYYPKPPVLDGGWEPPAVVRV